MTRLLELREQIRKIYHRYDRLILAGGKFVLSLLVQLFINTKIGYGDSLFTSLLPVLLSLFCAFLPSGFITAAACLTILLQSFFLSTEIGMTVSMLLIIVILLYTPFKPRYSVLAAAAMLCCGYNVSGILPIAVGLMLSPLELIPLSLGLFGSYMVTTISDNYLILAQTTSDLSSMEKIIYYLQSLFQNEKMYLLIVSYIFTLTLVWFIRRRPYSYSWSIAIASGVVVFVLMMLAGNLMFNISIRPIALAISCVASVVLSGFAMLFSFVLDGSRSEYLEYEDENYYYFVRAIPKVSVSVSDKKITNITNKAEEEEPWEADKAGDNTYGDH